MQAEQSILDRIQRWQLEWYEHLLKMEYSHLQWSPHGRRRRGKQQQSWKTQVADFVRNRNMEEGMGEDKPFWCLAMDRRLLAV